MDQIKRIERMERILDEASEAVSALHDALERYREIRPRLAELEAYYTSPQWMKDYEDDCAGRIPAELKRGVLSEDAVYDLLALKRGIDDALKA